MREWVEKNEKFEQEKEKRKLEENEKDKKSIRILNYYYCTFLLNIFLLGSADDAMLETFPKIKRSKHINRIEDFPSEKK